MPGTLTCEICGVDVERTNPKQKTCLSRSCQSKLRGRTRSQSYYELRPNPICIWCKEPILEPRKRKYHTECRADKNAERVRSYNRVHILRPGSKKRRNYKGTLECEICHTTVKRTGARQIICLAPECRRKQKQKNKKKLREMRKRQAAIRQVKEASYKIGA